MARRADAAGWRGAMLRGALSLASGLCLGVLAVLTSCGGGSGVDSGGTGGPAILSAAVGPISGFGSVVVAGVHYDERGASLTDDDDQPLAGDRLQLGVTAQIEGGRITDLAGVPSAQAIRIRLVEQLVGPVSQVDLAGCAVTVLGQRVVATAATVLDTSVPAATGSCRLGGVRAGMVLGVYGSRDAALGRVVATRLDQRPGATRYLLRAPVEVHDAAARLLTLGGQRVSLAALPSPLPSFVVGEQARLYLRTVQDNGLWVAVAARSADTTLPAVERMEVQGRITQFTSATRFSVDGVAVDGSAATFPQGTAGLKLGAKVEVEGRPSGTSLVATVVKVEAEDGEADAVVEIEGQISAIDRAAQTFVVRGTVISYAGSPAYEGGTSATLALQRQVSVKGHLSANGQQVIADSIHIED